MEPMDSQDSKTKPIRIFIIAGEPSGDLLGARLMAALQNKSDKNFEFCGIGGERMVENGLQSEFPISELSVMGIAEILPQIFNLRRRVKETVATLTNLAPDILVTIDSPGFCFAVLKRLKKTDDCIRVHYVAPTVWAWRPGRVRKFGREFDHLLTLLPFEPQYFEPVNLPSTFVGHAVLESPVNATGGPSFRTRFNINDDIPLICVLPGSRRGEVRRHIRPFFQAIDTLRKRFPSIRVVIPTIASLRIEIEELVSDWNGDVVIVEGESDKFDAMAASNVALAASGTVSLELALNRLPAVIAYRVNIVTSWIVKLLIKVRYANIVNILLDQEAVPEFIQGKCTPDRLAASLEELLEDRNAYEKQQVAAAKAMKMLRAGEELPSNVAAATILSLLSKEGA